MNALSNSTSPYLKQHAHQPVQWLPWGPEAFSAAQASNKLILVSIGYSTCHWCHVMAHEVFEDTSTAEFQNRSFVSIKVDREERPDIDRVYMDACRLLTGQGGWPLNVICLPDGRPIHAVTYLPKESWIQLIGQIHLLWLQEPAKLLHQADAISDAVQSQILPDSALLPVQNQEDFRRSSADLFREIWSRIKPQCDSTAGGLKGAPKFPLPVSWEVLAQFSALFPPEDQQPQWRKELQQQVSITLERLAQGGIFDQIGGGFFRYSTDASWHVPHFEKMLYDNGLLLSLFARAQRNEPSPQNQRILRLTIDWLNHALSAPHGLWYSALNADTNGVEGETYLWTQDQVFTALPDSPDLENTLYLFDISTRGNWEDGKSIPRVRPGLPLDPSETWVGHLKNIEAHRIALLAARNMREQPSLDNKIILEWNALVAKGLLDAGRSLSDPRTLSQGLITLESLLSYMRNAEGNFVRTRCEDQFGEPAFLSDLVMLADACFTAYETTLAERWIVHAKQILQEVLTRFQDPNSVFCTLRAQDQSPLFASSIDIQDDVIPSANSVLARLLLRLGWESKGKQMILAMRETALNSPLYHMNWIRGLWDVLFPGAMVHIQGAEAQRWAKEVWMHYPNAVIDGSWNAKEQTFARVCVQGRCLPDVHNLKDLLKALAQA